MNQTQTRSLRKKVLSLILAVVMAVSLLPISAFASGNSTSTTATTPDGYEYNIMFLDCGRKYYSVDSIKQIIDNASAAGFNYIQLAVGNDGLRFLLDDNVPDGERDDVQQRHGIQGYPHGQRKIL